MTRQDALAVTFDFSDPRRSAALAVGAAAAPFWAPLFATAASAGVAWWWMTGWTRLDVRKTPVAPVQAEPTPAAATEAVAAIDITVGAEVVEPSPSDQSATVAEQPQLSESVVEAPTVVEATVAPAAAAKPKARKSPKSKAAATRPN